MGLPMGIGRGLEWCYTTQSLLFPDHGGTPSFLPLLFFSSSSSSSISLSFFLLGGWAGVSIPLVYIFLDSKAFFVVCFYST